jgi:hypothetical protein
MVMVEKDPVTNLRQFLKKRKSSATNNPSASVVSPSPKKARKSERRKLIQNDKWCPCVPTNGKLFSPVELCHVLLPLDAAERWPLVSHFVGKDWLHHKGQDASRGVRPFMQKALANPDALQPCWNNKGGQDACDDK